MYNNPHLGLKTLLIKISKNSPLTNCFTNLFVYSSVIYIYLFMYYSLIDSIIYLLIDFVFNRFIDLTINLSII